MSIRSRRTVLRPESGGGLLRLAAVLWLAILLWSGSAWANQDPRWRWRTLETDHFRIHYVEHLEPIARRMATIAERAHRNLSRQLDWQPRRLTHLVVLDDTDYAQGITYVGAQNVIRLWVAAPEADTTLEDFDDWFSLLIIHEYTHLIHIDQARGIPVLINSIFGQVYHPMQFTPTWLTEGYAVHEESTQTSGGRVRSTMFDMYLRMAVLEDEFVRIDQATNSTRLFPQGNVPYLYGQDFLNYIARRFGDDSLRALAHEMNNDAIPYGLNRAFRRAVGHSVIELWEDWRRSLEVGYRAWEERIREQGLTESRQLTDFGERTGPPRFNHDGSSIYVYHQSEESPSSIWELDVETGDHDRLTIAAGRSVLAPTTDGRHIYHARSDRHNIIYQYRDIFRIDLRTGREQRMTDGARAQSVDVSRDGRLVTYAANRTDSSDLWLANSELGSRRRLLRSVGGDQVYTPRFSPDGEQIAISRWRRGGYRDVQIIDVEDGSVREITNDQHLDTSPCFSPDGRWLLFSSDRTGIANLYAYDLENDQLRQMTNVISGAYSPDISPDGETVAFVGFSSRGFDVHTMPFDPDTFREPQPERERLAHVSHDRDHHHDEDEEPIRIRERRYNALATLAPRSWMLGLGQDAFGQTLQLTAFGQDVAATHALGATVNFGLEEGNVNYDINYQFNRFRPSISLRHARWVAPGTSYRVDTRSEEFIEETYLLTADLSVWLGRGLYSHRFWVGYELQYSRATTDLTNQDWDPSGRPPRFPSLGFLSGLRFGWSYSNARSSVRSISLERGRSLSTSVSLFHPAFGSDYFQLTFRYSWTEYIPMPWRHHHVLALSLSGGISAGDLYRNAFYIGGYPEQDIIQSLIDQSFLGGRYLRGYPSGVIGGSQYHMLNMEYRFPLWNPERGIYTLPVYLSHLWFAAFCDVGGAFAADLDFRDLLVGVGAEVVMRFIIGYFLPITVRVGYARGLMDGGENQVFAVLGLPF